MYWDFNEHNDYVIERTTGARLSKEKLAVAENRYESVSLVYRATPSDYLNAIDDFIEYIVEYMTMYHFEAFSGQDLELLRLSLYDAVLDAEKARKHELDPVNYPMERKVKH